MRYDGRVDEPRASRPYMPGYGTVAADSGSGLMAWSDAARALTESVNYWLATAGGPGGAPHLMPVWGVWHARELWFSSGGRSRKVRNIEADPRCTASTEDAEHPVIVSGVASIVVDPAEIATFLELLNAKYDTSYGLDFLDPAVNATVRLRPEWAFALRHEDFTGSPTRWRF
jgi:general stress protein 26